MITSNASLSLRRIGLDCLQVKEYQPRALDQLVLYFLKLRQSPQDDLGVLHVRPSDTHQGMFVVLDGHHKLCALLMSGRSDALCLVVEEQAE